MAAPHLHLLLSIEICQDKLHLALLDTHHRLAVIHSTTVHLRCEHAQDPRRDTAHDSSAAYDPNQPRKSTAGSRAVPFAVRDYLEGLDDALELLCTASPPSLSSSGANASASLASKIVAISITSAPELRVMTSRAASSTLQSLSPDKSLHSQLASSAFLAHPLLLHDLIKPQLSDLLHLENRLAERAGLHIIDGGGERIRRDPNLSTEKLVSRESFRRNLARRLGGSLDVDSLPVQLAAALSSSGRGKTQSTWGQLDAAESLAHTDKIVEMGMLFACILTGKLNGPSAIEASMTGFLNVDSQQWDEGLIAVIATSINPSQDVLSAEGLKGALGVPRRGAAPAGQVSPWLTKRFHFDSSCVVMSSVPSHLASYFSHLPQQGDIGLQLGSDDYLIVPTTTPVFVSGARTLPHPLASELPTNAPRLSSSHQLPTPTHLVIAKATGAGHARKTIRDVYTNANWDAFQKLMSAVCAGGSIGMDNKFYSVCRNFETKEDVKRYEMGIRVEEFSDLRANARCIVEGQALSVRSSIGRIWGRDRESSLFLGEAGQSAFGPVPSNVDFACGYHGVGGALGFDPYDASLCPVRLLAWGKAAHNRGMAECYANVLGGTWTTQREHDRREERRQGRAAHTSSKAEPSRAALGAAYLAFATLEAQSAEQGGDFFAGFHTVILDRLSGRESILTPPPSDAIAPALKRKVSHTVATSGKMVLATSSLAPTNPAKLAAGGRARSSSSPITAFGGSSTSSRASTLSSGSSSPFAMDTVSLILSPSSSSYFSSPLNTGLRSANAWATAATSADAAGKHPLAAGARPRTSSNLPAPLHPTLLTVLDEGEEDMTTPRNLQDLSTQQTGSNASEMLIADDLDRLVSVLGRMTSAPNFSSSLAMTNAFQPIGTAAAGRSRASSSSASSWGDAPRRDGVDGTSTAAITPRVQWSSSVAPSRSNSFSSAFSPDAKPFVSEANVSEAMGSAATMSGRPRSTTLHTIGTTSRWPWTQINPAVSATRMLRSSSSSLSTSDVRQRSSSGSSAAINNEAGASRALGGASIEEGLEKDVALGNSILENSKAAGSGTLSQAHTHGKANREPPAESKQEKAMRAWLQGQSLSPPVLSDAQRATSHTSGQHMQGGASATLPQQRQAQIQSQSQRQEAGNITSSGPLDDLSLSYFDPLCKSDSDTRALAQAHASSHSHSPAQQQQQRQQQQHLWEARLRALDAQRRESEKLLGLERGPAPDLDVWAVYGALLEEYVRLRGH